MADLPVAELQKPKRLDFAAFFRRYAALTALLVLLAFNLAYTPNFASWQTINVNLTQVAEIVIVAVGMTLVIATGGIDVGAKAEIQKLIRELADQGLGVLMISSELEEIVEGADRVFVLSDGVTVADLSHAEASAPALMAAMAHDKTLELEASLG